MKTADYSFLKTTEMSCLNKIHFNVIKDDKKQEIFTSENWNQIIFPYFCIKNLLIIKTIED